MNSSAWPAVAMIVGLSLMGVGYWYESLVPTQSVWTDEQARELGEASARFHSASFGKDHSHDPGSSHSHDVDHQSPEYQQAKAVYEAKQGELDRSRQRHVWIKYGIVLTGVVMAGWGVVRVAIDKMNDDETPAPRRSKQR